MLHVLSINLVKFITRKLKITVILGQNCRLTIFQRDSSWNSLAGGGDPGCGTSHGSE